MLKMVPKSSLDDHEESSALGNSVLFPMLWSKATATVYKLFHLHRATFVNFFFKFSCPNLFYLSRAIFYKFKTKKSKSLYHTCVNISILFLPKIVMPAVHSRRVHLARVSGESCPRRYCVSATLYTLAESSQSMRNESEARVYRRERE